MRNSQTEINWYLFLEVVLKSAHRGIDQGEGEARKPNSAQDQNLVVLVPRILPWPNVHLLLRKKKDKHLCHFWKYCG